nr:MAG: replication associated protein [Cressdnaviricota sp.]
MPQPRRQGIFWCLTIPGHMFVPYLPPSICWIRGQLERGDGGYVHWQLLCAFRKKESLAGVRSCFGEFHAELSRSEAAAEYVWKEDTRIAGTQFELGCKPIRRNASIDWESIWTAATLGQLMSIPASIRIQSYRTLCQIRADNAKPIGMERTCVVFWGRTGSGKSRDAWAAAGMDAYPKDPRTKFWCGYSGQGNVVLDEFRGGIDVGHILRWLDRYPVIVEKKGSSEVLTSTNFWITSNLDPRLWYPDLDDETQSALLRRLNITHYH